MKTFSEDLSSLISSSMSSNWESTGAFFCISLCFSYRKLQIWFSKTNLAKILFLLICINFGLLLCKSSNFFFFAINSWVLEISMAEWMMSSGCPYMVTVLWECPNKVSTTILLLHILIKLLIDLPFLPINKETNYSFKSIFKQISSGGVLELCLKR